MTTVRLKQTDYEAIVAHAKSWLPSEACGLIAGAIDDNIKTVEKVYLLPNPDRSPVHFSIDPKEQLAMIKDMRANGFVPLGNFHSHPATPARPSEEDIKMFYDSKASYLILSLADETPVLKAFGVADGEAIRQELEIF
ncbi:MAG: M67 family metallopeptidase [Chitinispirillales bacterium]|jgi:proteasome lid subunit RPN8/RPN11|nr:M67 family metallopeptidase [Chitinispirillales bacterium]